MTVIILIIQQFIQMAEGNGTFGGSMQTSGKLHQMLMQPNLTPEDLFSIPNMNGDIKQNIQAFLNFCKKKREFTTRLFKISLNSSYHELSEQKAKKVAQYAIDVLTNDQDALCSFLFDKKQELKNSSEISQKIEDTTTPTIQSQAQRLFSDPPTNKQQASWENESDAFQRYQLVGLTLAHLKQNVKNQTCLGYINKLYSALLRREGNLFLEFLKQKPEYIDILINNICHFSIGNMIALVLSCEDKSGQYKHQQLKKSIFDKILQYGLDNINDNQKFSGFLVAVQQILNSTKQSYYEYFQDFKRCANTLVSEETLRKFYAKLDKDESSFGNASSYLQLILKRINGETEDHDYYRQNQNSQPTMKFQHNFFLNQFHHLLELIEKSHKYSSVTKIIYLSFLINLLKNIKDKPIDLSNTKLFEDLLVFQSRQKIPGLVKNYLFQIIKIVIKRMNQNQIKQVGVWLVQKNLQSDILKGLFSDVSTINKNSHQSSCFILSILFDFQAKQNSFLKDYTEKNKINLTQTYDKFKTKLADYGEQEAPSPSYDHIELSFKMFTKNQPNQFLPAQPSQRQVEKQSQTQTVGKNHVVIPVLNLPTKVDTTKVIIEQEPVQHVQIPAEISRQALIRDLKNTRIQLPQKFKPKKNQQTEKKKQQAKQQVLSKLQSNQQAPKKQNSQTISYSLGNAKSVPGPDPQQQKYFIRHILLF